MSRYKPKVFAGLCAGVFALVVCFWTNSHALRGGGRYRKPGPAADLSLILGRPTDTAITLSLLSRPEVEACAEIGTASGGYSRKTPLVTARAGAPIEIEMAALKPDTQYFYRVLTRKAGDATLVPGLECSFHTQRRPGSSFTFDLQGDSHPEREGKMYSPDLYAETLRSAALDHPDFYITLGDDFSIENLLNRLSQPEVDSVYAHQRSFLNVVGSNAALFLVNGNHEQAARHWLNDTPVNPAVMAGLARNRFYPLPTPNGFYTGDPENVKYVGLLRDYYAWTWGDALFVVIDPYWHSPVGVDDGRVGKYDPTNVAPERNGGGGGQRKRNGADAAPEPGVQDRRQGGRKRGQGGGGKGSRDLWQITLGEEQYRWLAKTLKESRAKYKFVFAHHVSGTGRGGVEVAGLYEWGGKDRRGIDRFQEMRPGWEMPIHSLFVKTGVTIFFQGHDHIYARQELDGVVYQSTPNPADDTYTAFNREAYQSGTQLPNAGHLRVYVAPEGVTVDYVRSFLKKDENATRKNGMVVNSYTVHSHTDATRAAAVSRQ